MLKMDCLFLGFLEMGTVELVIHHGGNFVKDLELQYINGEVWEVDIDPDLLSYPHLVKFIKEGQYGKIETLYYKALHEPLNKLRVLWNDASVLDLTELAIKYRSCDIYVDHGIDEADLIPCYLLPGCGEPTEGNVSEEPNEGIDGEEPNEGIVGEEPNEGRQSVGDEVNEESDEVNEDATEVSTDDNAEVNEESDDEGIEGDDDNYDSAGDDTELSEFENDFGGVTQEDNTGQGLEGEDLETETDKGKSKDPPSHESEIEEVVTQTTTPPRKKLKLPSYNPESDFPELEKGMLFEDAKQFKTAHSGLCPKKRNRITGTTTEEERYSRTVARRRRECRFRSVICNRFGDFDFGNGVL
nr:Transposase, MuDR, plant [Ipomoea batatas]